MKVSTFAFTTFIAFTSAAISTANAQDQCAGHACKEYLRTGTAFDIAQQYSLCVRLDGPASPLDGRANPGQGPLKRSAAFIHKLLLCMKIARF